MKETKDILYYDRYSGETRKEEIYGERALRWAYETVLGRFALGATIKRRWFSRLYGRWADCRCSAREIPAFIEHFGVDTTEFSEDPGSFRTFNEFFHRRLKPEARPIDPDPAAAIFPTDGRHLAVSGLSGDRTFFAKGQRLNLAKMLGDATLAERFEEGTAVFSRLCPTDYHRYHFPVGGHYHSPRPIDGPLLSVSPIALSRKLSILWENKRRVSLLSDTPGGEVLIVEIGATNVGSIVDTAAPEERVEKGEEKGFFRFGGSMIVTLFEPGRFYPADDLRNQSDSGLELYARMGDRMGTVR